MAGVQAVLLAGGGRIGEAEEKIRIATKKRTPVGHFHHTAHFIASAYARMNKPEQAVRWLDEAAESGFPCHPLLANDPSLDPVRNHPQFIAFLARMRQQFEQYKAALAP